MKKPIRNRGRFGAIRVISGPNAGSRRGRSIPPAWRKELRAVAISEELVARRVAEMGREIQADFQSREWVVVAVLTGTVMFLADLIRQFSVPLRLDFIGVSSYRGGTRPGRLIFTKELSLDVKGRDVLLVDDILDTGQTLSRVLTRLRQLSPRRIKVCVLLQKNVPRRADVRADYVGFIIPDWFVVGYGLDFNERYRNLPFIGVLDPAVTAPAREKNGRRGGRAKPQPFL